MNLSALIKIWIRKMLSIDGADIRVAVKNKVPLVRSLTLTWVAFCIETSNKATVLKLHKEYVPICMEVNDYFILLAISFFFKFFVVHLRWSVFHFAVLEWWYSRSTRCFIFCFDCHSQGFLESFRLSSLHYMYQNVALMSWFFVTFTI